MPWFKVDDQLALHRKARAAGNAAMGLWVRAGSLCAAQLDDGHVDSDVPALLGGKRTDAARLENAGLWHAAGHGCDECPQPRDPRGWVFHDWAAHQPTKAAVEQKRLDDRQRKADARAEKKAKTDAEQRRLKAVNDR